MEDRRALLPRRVHWQRQAWRPQQWWERRPRNWLGILRAAACLCALVLILTTLALFSSVGTQQGGGSGAIAAANGTQLLLQRGRWMELAPLVGHVVPRALVVQQEGIDELPLSPLQDSDDVQRINSMIEAISGTGTEREVLNSARPRVKKFCMYSERNSGSNWVASLLQANFELDYITDECPHKHDLGLSVPNEFLFLAPDTLVIGVFRNAMDWVASMHRHPWHAKNHCNVTFPHFVTREWSPMHLAGRPNWLHATPWCPKYDTNHSNMPMIYETFSGAWAQNILELRAWKARRILELCQVRHQSACVRHEDLIENTTTWLLDFQEQFKLRTRPGFPIEVFDYKGVKNSRKFVPFSEYNQFRYGNGHSAYYNADILQNFRRHLDLPLETDLGYFYTDIFSRWLPEDAELAHYHFDLPEGLKGSVSQPPADNTSAPAEGSAPDMEQTEGTLADGALSMGGGAGEQPSTGAVRRALTSTLG